MMAETETRDSNKRAVRDLENKKADLIVQIRELQLELMRANVEIHRLGADDAVDIRSFLTR